MAYVWVAYYDWGYEGHASPQEAGTTPEEVIEKLQADDGKMMTYPVEEKTEDMWFFTYKTQEQAGPHPREGWRIERFKL